jgi:hypothetical protein
MVVELRPHQQQMAAESIAFSRVENLRLVYPGTDSWK